MAALDGRKIFEGFRNPSKESPNKLVKVGDTGYSASRTPLTYSDRSMMKTNPKSPFTRVKPLLPNILDQIAIESVNWAAAQKRRSGHKWHTVKEI
jgi:hypothetical protein